MSDDRTCRTIAMIIVAILLPPLAVFIERGCSGSFWLNVILWILGWVPGIIHAIYVIIQDNHIRERGGSPHNRHH
ncbi:transmembrane protein [Tieghemostelium lacteum]|uniref:Transmembrane protein n=1 Tax=Tieghemostelium lacteum TaxID=361077 RepID=A0A152A867_TIELA|nr:transmembrane protein [Tieghemostelium lacteum]|eukprot:KYR02394.1 transmembrane protein [Tieghemostelium lacteum]